VDQVYREGGKIDQKNQELIAPVVEQINQTVSKMAADDGFALVIDATKSDIVYAETGLDLTELVVAELNRAYAPSGPTTTLKQVYAVMPIFETNDQARQDGIGNQIRQFCYDLVRAQPKVDMVANQKSDEQLTARGLAGRQLGQTEALDVARILVADYAIFGECNKDDRKVNFTLSIVDVQLNNLVKAETGQANRVEDLQEQIARVVQLLLTSVEKP